jgi:crotonobetainyl-CoA:carnitine CoA-transferase CaiB-like acyl-CoA transferase
MTLPLSNLLVISLEQAVAAPMCSCRLADAGARVIKIERPEGDFARYYDRLAQGESAYFVWLNRGKESVCLDLMRPDDKALLSALLARADVFIQNLKPGAIAKLGFPLDRLHREHPRLVICSISGYGERGPYSARKAYGMLIQAENRPGVGYRQRGRTRPRRRLGVRHRGGYECLRGHSRGADRPRTQWARRRAVGSHVRRHGGLDDGAAAAI